MKKENISIIISLLSLLVAISAVAIPYFQSQSKEKEIVKIDVQLNKNEKISFLNEKVIQFPFQITISNNSFVPLSIIDYDFYQFDYNREAYTFDGIKGNILPVNEKLIKLPIYLESGKSVKFTAFVGYRATLKNKEILDDTIINLEKRGLVNVSGIVNFDKKNENIPIYLVRITTNRNNYFYRQLAIGTGYELLSDDDISYFSSQFGIPYINLTNNTNINYDNLFRTK